MSLSQHCALLEGLLLVAPQGASLAALAHATAATAADVAAALTTLDVHYRTEGHGLRILRSGDGDTTEAQLVASADHAVQIGRFLGTAAAQKLSPAALETLAVIAYRQPVTRTEIEAIRGVNCDTVLSTLLARDLIAESGRAESVGRPVLYQTTSIFLARFGLTSLADLPPLKQDTTSPRLL